MSYAQAKEIAMLRLELRACSERRDRAAAGIVDDLGRTRRAVPNRLTAFRVAAVAVQFQQRQEVSCRRTIGFTTGISPRLH